MYFTHRKTVFQILVEKPANYTDIVYPAASAQQISLCLPPNTVLVTLGCPFTTYRCTTHEMLNSPPLRIRQERFGDPQYWWYRSLQTISWDYHRSRLLLPGPVIHKSAAKKVFMFKAPSDWNNLPSNTLLRVSTRSKMRSILIMGSVAHLINSTSI